MNRATLAKRLFLFVLFLIPTVLAIRFYLQAQRLAGTTQSAAAKNDAPKPEPAAKPSPQLWTCPMHPNYIADHPGTCPICGMDLVRKEDEPAAAAMATPAPEGFSPISMDAQRQQLIGVRPVLVRRLPFSGSIRTSGRIAYDETRVYDIHTKYEAYVERLYADYTGKAVRRGEPLVALYSPDLYSAEQEYLIALRSSRAAAAAPGPSRNREQGHGSSEVDMLSSAREKLRLWDVRDADIARLTQSGQPRRTLELTSPVTGYVLKKSVVHGSRVEPKDALFRIADLSRVWVLADVYEYELPRVAIGQSAEVTLPYWPGKSFAGRINYVYPEVDPKTRTVKVRLEVENPGTELKVDMLANVEIKVAPRVSLVVPEDAVIETGERKLVFLIEGDSRLVPREIRTSGRAEHLYEVQSGLAEGQKVAAGASFLLDSESRLRALQKPPSALENAAPKPEDHSGHGGHGGPGGHSGHGGG